MCTALSIALCWCPKAGKVPSRIYWGWICDTMVRSLRSLRMIKSVSQGMLKWNSASIKNAGAGRASSSTFCDCTRQPLVYPRVYSSGPLVVSGHQGSIPEARCPGSGGRSALLLGSFFISTTAWNSGAGPCGGSPGTHKQVIVFCLLQHHQDDVAWSRVLGTSWKKPETEKGYLPEGSSL